MNQQTQKLVWGIVGIVVVIALVVYIKPLSLMRSGSSVGPSLSLTPASFTAEQGKIVSMDIMLDTSGANIDGVDVYSLRFNPSVLQVQDDDSAMSGVQITSGTLLPNTILNKVDNVNGTVQFSQLTAGGTTYIGSGKLATVHFNPISAGSTTVNIDFSTGKTNDSNIAGSGGDLLASVINSSVMVKASSTTPTLAPMPAPILPAPAPAAPAPISTKFKVSDAVQVTTKISVRQTAGGTLLGTQTTGVKGTVIGGPSSANNIIWWQVNFASGVDGWVSEKYLKTI